MSLPPRAFLPRPVRAAVVAAVGMALALSLFPRVSFTSSPDFPGACEAGEPYFVTACYLGLSRASSQRIYDGDAPSLVVLSDTPNNSPRYQLASFDEIGAVWGLAYQSAENAVYAAAFHKRQLPFGPNGPGAIYRIDLSSGSISHVIRVPNVGPDSHDYPMVGLDRSAEAGAGRTGLGDLDISEAEDELAVVNLDDGHIYRFALPSGNLIGSFANGGSAEPWSAEARPFGLAYHDGELYHGVVRSAEESLDQFSLRALVYRSAPDGAGMKKVADFPLIYERGRMAIQNVNSRSTLDWQPWDDGRRRGSGAYDPFQIYPMPILADLEFDVRGNLIAGLHDRHSDASHHYIELASVAMDAPGMGVGDLLLGTPTCSGWAFEPREEHFDDAVSRFGDESALGGLAYFAPSDHLVAGSYAVDSRDRQEGWQSAAGLFWYDGASGNKLQLEPATRRVCVTTCRRCSRSGRRTPTMSTYLGASARWAM